MMIPPGLSGPYCQPLPWLPPIAPVAAPIGTLTLSNPSEDSFEMEGGHAEEGGSHSEGSHGGHGEHGSSKLGAAYNEVKHHGTATVLMGAGTLLMNFIPGFKMSWPSAAKFAVANMVMMVLIAAGLGVAKASHGSESHGGH